MSRAKCERGGRGILQSITCRNSKKNKNAHLKKGGSKIHVKMRAVEGTQMVKTKNLGELFRDRVKIRKREKGLLNIKEKFKIRI